MLPIAALVVALLALALGVWATLLLRRALSALAALQQQDKPVLPGMLPMTHEKVEKQIEEALRRWEAAHGAGRAVLAVLLEQSATEIVHRMPYDAGQRKLAIEQRLLRHYARQGLPVPEEARLVLKQGGWL